MHLPLLLEFEVLEEEEMFALTCIEITPVTQNIEQHWAKIAIYLGFKSKDLVFHLQLFSLLRQNCWVLHLPTDKSFESEANWLEILPHTFHMLHHSLSFWWQFSRSRPHLHITSTHCNALTTLKCTQKRKVQSSLERAQDRWTLQSLFSRSQQEQILLSSLHIIYLHDAIGVIFQILGTLQLIQSLGIILKKKRWWY